MQSVAHLDPPAAEPPRPSAAELPVATPGGAEAGAPPRISPAPGLASMDVSPAPSAVQPGRLVPAEAPDFDASLLDELRRLFIVEANRLHQHGSSSMSVALRVGANIEMFVHFTQLPGGIEVQARCEQRDQPRLQGVWPRLTAVLAPRLRLAPLPEAIDPETARFAASANIITRMHPERRRRFRRPGWETWA